MKIENEGLTLWYGTSDTPAPEGAVRISDDISVMVGVSPIGANNKVELHYRINQGTTKVVLAQWWRNALASKTQYFLARFPELRDGDAVDYSVVCYFAGRQVPSVKQLQQLFTSFRVVSALTEPVAKQPSQPQIASVSSLSSEVMASLSGIRSPGVPIEVSNIPYQKLEHRVQSDLTQHEDLLMPQSISSGTASNNLPYPFSGSTAVVKGESDTRPGVYGRSKVSMAIIGESETSVGVYGISQTSIGVWGDSETGDGVSGSSRNGTGVQGESHAGIGVKAVSKNGIGLAAYSTSNEAIHAQTNSNVAAIAAYNLNSKGDGFAIFSKKEGDKGFAGFFDGHVWVGKKLSVGDDIVLANADCAEDFDIAGLAKVEPGTVMVIESEGALRESDRAYDKRVAGVISGAGKYKPGIVLDKQESSNNRMPIALMGKVYCKVDASYGAIEVGDLLTTSQTPGHAMRADDPFKAFGAVIGKALRPLTDGQGLIPILIALQ